MNKFRLNKNICRAISRVDIFIPSSANLISIRRSKNGMVIFNILKLFKNSKAYSEQNSGYYRGTSMRYSAPGFLHNPDLYVR